MRHTQRHPLLALQALLFLLLCFIAPAALAKGHALAPGMEQEHATQLITHLIENFHYKKVPLDDKLSEQILRRYLEALDPNKLYFLASDIKAFQIHRDRIDDYLKSATLEPLFGIFKVFRERVDQRVAFAKKLLAQDFEFTVDEAYTFDRKHAPWAASTEELNDLWRRRVKNDILTLRLSEKAKKAKGAKGVHEDERTVLSRRYDALDRRSTQLSAEDVFQIAINAYTTSIDPHTNYLSPRSSENFRIRMSLSLEGIGAVLQAKDDQTVIKELVPGGPAALSGKIHPEDVITGIAQGPRGHVADVVGWRLDDVVELVRGPKGTVVRLRILPKGIGAPKEISLVRDNIQLENQAVKKEVIEIPGATQAKRIGVITVPAFYMDFDAHMRGDKNYRSTTRDTRRLITDLLKDGIDGLIIDLRGNGGGSLTEATDLTGLFIHKGPVVQVRDSTGRVKVEADEDPTVSYEGPLVVLVDRESASASEIFAGAIQDYQRGLIIGEPTFGKGTVQNLIDLNRFDHELEGHLGQLKTTIAQFFRVAGASTQHRGVIPEIDLPAARGLEEPGERALENALAWDQIPAAAFTAEPGPALDLERARRLHTERMRSDPMLLTLGEEIAAVERVLRRDQITLQGAKREAEQVGEEGAHLARINRIRALRGLKPLALGDEEDEKEIYDVLLHETAYILHDLISPTSVGIAAPTTVPSSPAPAATAQTAPVPVSASPQASP
jgi:carboxyl-terminal processing protease